MEGTRRNPDFDIDSLLHPARAFDHPDDVTKDPDLTLNEKRAILASWASDACAVDSYPTLRRSPSGRTVTFDDILDALRSLDMEAAKVKWSLRGRLKRSLQTRRPNGRSGAGGPDLC